MTAGGPGGQHQNKTASAVRMTHLPTGLVVVCRDERSQHKNRAKAMRLSAAGFTSRSPRRPGPSATRQRRTLIGSGDRSQRIRTYNFPQNRVTDHRIGLTLYNLDRVIQGELGPLTTALIDHDRREQLGEVLPMTEHTTLAEPPDSGHRRGWTVGRLLTWTTDYLKRRGRKAPGSMPRCCSLRCSAGSGSSSTPL